MVCVEDRATDFNNFFFKDFHTISIYTTKYNITYMIFIKIGNTRVEEEEKKARRTKRRKKKNELEIIIY